MAHSRSGSSTSRQPQTEPMTFAEEVQIVKLTDTQALLFWQQYDYWLNVEGATEEKGQQYAWEDVRREWPELPDKPDADALEALER